MNKLLVVLLLVFTNCFTNYAQENSTSFEFLPSGLHFMPLKANIPEARLGIYYFPQNANLKVDVGNSIDLIKFGFENSKYKLTLGIDFFAYAWATSYNGNRLQIDALDGFFGGNTSFSYLLNNSKIVSRFRIIHNSAHLVDGHWDDGDWLNGDKPIPYTRDFGELVTGYRSYERFGNWFLYGAISYSTLVRPSSMKKWTGFAGAEMVFDNLLGVLFEKPTNLFITYQIGAAATPNYTTDQHLIAGIKLGGWETKGITFYFSYYKGRNFYSEFFDEQSENIGIGFTADFF